MTTFPARRNFLMVESCIHSATAQVQRIIALQYNPESLSRTIQMQNASEGGNAPRRRAVLPQGSERSDFGDLRSNSDAYLTEVFAKLVPKYLPNGAIPGRVIVSGHSGGGPTAMAIAAKSGKRTDVLLFDAINFGCEKVEKKVDGKTVIGKDGNPERYASHQRSAQVMNTLQRENG